MASSFRDRLTVITGASSGIGLALARRFARDRARLVLVARSADRLAALAEEIRRDGGEAQVLVADLVADAAAERVVAAARAVGEIEVLVNNAGVGEYGPFAEKDYPASERMMRLNMDAVTRLTHLALPAMLARRSGWILNVASMAGFQPTPHMGVYGATKAFVRNFSLALREEVRRRGVVVSCLCPGPVRTGFFSRGGYEARMKDFDRFSVDADWVAEKAFRALARGRALCVPGAMNQAALFLQRFAPLTFVTRVSGKVLGPP